MAPKAPSGPIELAAVNNGAVTFNVTTENTGTVSHDGKRSGGRTWTLVLMECRNAAGEVVSSQADYNDASFPVPDGAVVCVGQLILYPDGIERLAVTDPFPVG